MSENTLPALCRAVLEEKRFDHLKNKGLVGFLFKKPIEKDDLIQLIDKYTQLPVNNLSDHLYFLYKVVSIVIASQDSQLLKLENWTGLIKKVQLEDGFDTIQITQALKHLIFVLMKKKHTPSPAILLPSSTALIDRGYHFSSMQLPDIQINAQLAGVWALAGGLTKNSEWLSQAEKLAMWHLNVLDQSWFPMAGLWVRQEDYDPITVLCSFYFMFFSVGSFIDNSYLSVAEKILLHIKEMLFEKKLFVPSYLVFMCQMIENLSLPKNQEKQAIKLNQTYFIDPSLGFCLSRSQHFDIAMTLRGLNSGIGTVHCKDVKIVSFGPQFFPLNKNNSYGIYNLVSKDSHTKDTTAIHEDTISLKGWTRLCRFAHKQSNSMIFEPSALWTEIEANLSSKKSLLNISLNHQSLSQKIAFSFYIQAKTCHLGEEEFLSNTLQRYEGDPKTVSLRGKLASLCLNCQYVKKMHLIPLGVGESFWQSQFLLAYELDPNNKKCFIKLEKV